MSGTGCESTETLIQVSNGESLIKSFQLNDNVLVSHESGKWHVSRSLLRDASWVFYRGFSDPDNTALQLDFLEKAPFELFLQWLYTREYHEYEGYALDFECAQNYYNLDVLVDHSPHGMVWCAKAAYLACDLAQRLEATGFQNYAMKRLFHAYTVTTPIATVTPMMLQQCLPGDEHQQFLEDLVARNWGDTAIIDHEDPGWLTQLKNNDRFRNSFAIRVAEDKSVRRKRPMILEGYLILED